MQKTDLGAVQGTDAATGITNPADYRGDIPTQLVDCQNNEVPR